MERPVRYLRDNFVSGRTFLNDADLDQQRRQWLDDVANVRVHGTTHECPRDRFDRDERLLLQPLALRPYTSLVLADAPRRGSSVPRHVRWSPLRSGPSRCMPASREGSHEKRPSAPSRPSRHMLADLRMPGALEALEAISQGVDGATLTAPEAIEQLVGAQIQLRNNRRLQAAMRSSRLPAIKRLTEFDFSFQPSLRRDRRRVCTRLGFIERRANVVFLGPPGVGKTDHR